MLIVAATAPETALLRDFLPFVPLSGTWYECYRTLGPAPTTIIHTGIGMVNTALALGDYFSRNITTAAINVGIAGSFDREIPPGQVVEIVEDSFSELGAEDNGAFLTLAQMGFSEANTLLPYSPERVFSGAQSLPKVTAITVNTVHGEGNAIALAAQRWGKQLESMEGAAFFLACQRYKIPCRAFRAISNYVEPRDRSKWQIQLALKNAQDFVQETLINA